MQDVAFYLALEEIGFACADCSYAGCSASGQADGIFVALARRLFRQRPSRRYCCSVCAGYSVSG